MSIENLRRLAERAERVEGREAGRLDEVHGRIRTARRQRAVTTSLAAFAVVGALVAGGALTVRGTDDTRGEIPQNTPAPSETVEVPDGQVTVTAQIGPGDIGDWQLKGSRSNTGGETDLSLVATARTLNDPMTPIVAFCNGTSDTWWVITYDLDGVPTGQPQDGQLSGTRGMSGQCAPSSPTSVTPPRSDIDAYRFSNSPQDYPLRMFVTAELSPDAQQCLSRSEDAEGCLTSFSISPKNTTDARFGFGVFEYQHGPAVLDVLGAGFEARAVVDGAEYLVDRAVVAGRGADRLVVTLPDSQTPRLIEVVARGTAATELCAESIDITVVSPETEEAHLRAFQRRCVPTLALRVDDALAYEQPGDGGLGRRTLVAPGPHVVDVDVVANDPSNVRYALVIWEARP